MSENSHHIDTLFKNAVEGHEEAPSRAIWENITGVLDKKQQTNTSTRLIMTKTVFLLLILILCNLQIHDLLPKFSFTKSSVAVENKKHESSPVSSYYKNKILQNLLSEARNVETGNTILPGITNTTKSEEKQKAQSIDCLVQTLTVRKFDESTIKLNQTDLNHSIANTAAKFIPIPVNSTKSSDQENNTNNKFTNGKSSRLSATIFFSVDFPFYRLKNNPPNNQPANKIENEENPDLSATAGILVDYKLNNHWSLEPGLSYSNSVILIDPKTIYAEKDELGAIKYRYDASSGYGYILPSFSSSPSVGDSLYTLSSTHILRYLNFPLALKYNFQKTKFNFFASAGVAANFLIKGMIETSVQDNSKNEIDVMDHLNGLKNIYFSGAVSLGAEYKFAKKFSLLISPTRRFAINSINKYVAVKSYPNSYGIIAGIHLQF